MCLGLSRNATYEGAIPAIRVGRRILVPAHALESFRSGPALREFLAATA